MNIFVLIYLCVTFVTSPYLLPDQFGPEGNGSQVNCLDVRLHLSVNTARLVQQRACWDTSLLPGATVPPADPARNSVCQRSGGVVPLPSEAAKK